MHLNKHMERTSDSCIFQLGWASSVLQLRTNRDLGRHTKVVSSAHVQQSYNISAVLFLQARIRKSKCICICSTGVFHLCWSRTNLLLLHERVPIPWFLSAHLPWLSKHWSLIISFDNCFSEIDWQPSNLQSMCLPSLNHVDQVDYFLIPS